MTHYSHSTDHIRKTWTIGSYPTLARSFLGAAATLVDAIPVTTADEVLDVACGTGNVALTAHRRGATVTAIDIAPAMLELARERAAVIDAPIDWHVGDAASLPVESNAFDITLSCLGHMFVHDVEAATDELVRATKPGGQVGFIAWTPTSAVAAMMQVLSKYVPQQSNPPPPPYLWGDPATVRDRFADRVTDLTFHHGTIAYPALSPRHFWQSMTTDSGGVILAIDTVAASDRAALFAEERETLTPYFLPDENAMELEYRLVTATVQ